MYKFSFLTAAWLLSFSACASLSVPAFAETASPAPSSAQEWVRDLAPEIWFHSRESYFAMDPVEFIRNSSLERRSVFGYQKMILSPKDVTPQAIRNIASGDPRLRPYQSGAVFNGAGYFLSYGPDTAAMKGLVANAPLLWRWSRGPFAQVLAADQGFEKRALVEFWYHSPYNWATASGVGNHQGDWENVAVLVSLADHRPRAYYFSAHEGGSWICVDEVSRAASGHFEAFSALGTHATYFHPGEHPTPWIQDLTDRGHLWQGWKHLRALEQEPYYGFSGAWGKPNWVSFMTGPLAPGPGYKYMPRDANPRDALRDYDSLKKKCGI